MLKSFDEKESSQSKNDNKKSSNKENTDNKNINKIAKLICTNVVCFNPITNAKIKIMTEKGQ